MGARVQRRTNDVVKPLVVLAARFLGPGALRLKLVKLAHELDDRETKSAAA